MTIEDRAALKAALLAYHKERKCWSALRMAFDDGDIHNSGLVTCRSHARARGDDLANSLIDKLMILSEIERRALRREVQEVLFNEAGPAPVPLSEAAAPTEPDPPPTGRRSRPAAGRRSRPAAGHPPASQPTPPVP